MRALRQAGNRPLSKGSHTSTAAIQNNIRRYNTANLSRLGQRQPIGYLLSVCTPNNLGIGVAITAFVHQIFCACCLAVARSSGGVAMFSRGEVSCMLTLPWGQAKPKKLTE